MMNSSLAGESTLLGILTSLLIEYPPTLRPEQLSENLRMRHRLLGFSPIPPRLTDIVDASCDHWPTGNPFWHELASWLVTNLGDEEEGHSLVEEMARCLCRLCEWTSTFHDVQEFMQEYVYTLCSPDWHTREGKRLVLIKDRSNDRPCLSLTLVQSLDGTVRFENMSDKIPIGPGDLDEDSLRRHKLHVWSDTCRCSSPVQQSDQDDGAEYIVDPDDFWAGYDEAVNQADLTGTASQKVQLPDMEVSGTTQLRSQQHIESEGVKDIIRQAYNLYRSTQSTDTRTKLEFIALVTQTLLEES